MQIIRDIATLHRSTDDFSIGMNDIAHAAGCSRATVYRYFENREALRNAYVHRHARAINRQLAELVAAEG